MTKICPSCGQENKETAGFCTQCGTRLPDQTNSLPENAVPQTIEELKVWAGRHHLPLEQMRFFLGQDTAGPKAFGIYQNENGNFVVYKNKADGTRSIRYQGPSEEFAVHELYEKMKAEISQRKGTGKQKNQSRLVLVFCLAVIVFAAAVFMVVLLSDGGPDTGYYTYGGQSYYYQSGDWYVWDDGWDPAWDIPSGLEDGYADYYDGTLYPDPDLDFSESDYYQEYEYDDSDSNYDWDAGDSWDSSGTDWDSDW